MSGSSHRASQLRRNTYSGVFIALEGLDGSGKTLQIPRITAYLEKLGKNVVHARAPRKDEGVLGAINQKILQEKLTIPRQAYQYLFTADYIIQMEDIIIPALKRGDIVLTDRFCGWSAVAYGIWEQNENYDVAIAESILAAHAMLTKSYQFIIPDVTFFLKASIPVVLKRLKKKHEVKEIYEEQETLMKVMKGYTWLLETFPQEFNIIDAEGSIAQVTKDMIKHLESYYDFRS